MHLIYFRFFAQVMKELGLIDFTEPVKKLFTQGMVCMEAHYCNEHKWLAIDEVKDGKCIHCGACLWNCSRPLAEDPERMNIEFRAGAGGLHSGEN